MEIIYLEEVDSTQKFLKNHINAKGYAHDIAVVTTNQTSGIGSRDNVWNSKKGNLCFSFTQHITNLPNDLNLQSTSIYYSFLLKNLLKEYKSEIWLKWPNDFYIAEKKIGGTITHLVNDVLYCGIGLNLSHIDDDYGYLDIDIDINKILEEYFTILSKSISWKEIFSLYKIEYELSKKFQATLKNQKISLLDSELCEDGSILIENQKVYSLR